MPTPTEQHTAAERMAVALRGAGFWADSTRGVARVNQRRPVTLTDVKAALYDLGYDRHQYRACHDDNGIHVEPIL